MRTRILVAAALGCLWLLPATASGSHVVCGQTITELTVLDSDVVCTDQDPVGLVIGGDNFTLWLQGHSIVGADAALSHGIADDGTVRSGVTIRGGSISGFDNGVDLDASASQVMGLTVGANSVGIALRGTGNYIFRNTVDMGAAAGFAGIEALGDDSHLWGNTVTGSATSPDDGIVVHGNNPRIIANSVTGCAFDGVIVTTYTAGLVARNSVTGCDIGFAPSGTGIKLQTNVASGNCIGIVVDDPAALVRWNTANDNCTEGIVIGQPGATLLKNVANNNIDIGIDAPDGTIDEGGNTATGNGVADCLGVVCLPPAP